MDKGHFVSVSTCLALHVPRRFVALCTFLFQDLPFLSISLSISPSCPPPKPSSFFSHWWFVFLLWDLGSHSLRTHYSALIHSRGWAPRGRMGDCGYSPPPPPHSLPCDDVMAFYLLQGYPLNLSLCSPLYLLLYSPPSLVFTPVFLCESLSKFLCALDGPQRI